MAVEKPTLPYAEDALEPHISKLTVSTHYGKHHLGYYNKLTGMIQGNDDEKKSLHQIITENKSVGLYNQAAQVYNHTFYWNGLKSNPKSEPNMPQNEVGKAIDAAFGSFDKFKEEFSAIATGHFGSGWAWLTYDKKAKKLVIAQTHDAGAVLDDADRAPLLTCDVWEHAYYLDYKNARPDYVKAFWNIVNWDFVNQNYKKATQ